MTRKAETSLTWNRKGAPNKNTRKTVMVAGFWAYISTGTFL